MKSSGDCPNLNRQPAPFSVNSKGHDLKEEMEINKIRPSDAKNKMKIINDRISGDGPNLDPQPLPCLVKPKGLGIKQELEINKSRLNEAKMQRKILKDRISKLIQILLKEVGDDTAVKDLLRHGHSSGWQGRAQIIMNLKLKLTSMQSKYLDPPHKKHDRGPFNSEKGADLKYLPEKQDITYTRMMEEKTAEIMLHEKPASVLKKELDDLKLMYKAARSRNKSLILKVSATSMELEKTKENSELDLRVVEAMMAHQSMYKMMIDPDTFDLDPTLKKHIKVDLATTDKSPEWNNYKMSFQKSEEEKRMFRKVTSTLQEKWDKINEDLLEAQQINTENKILMEKHKMVQAAENEGTGKEKGKESGSTEDVEITILQQENHHLREVLLHSVLSAEEDFRLFTSIMDSLRQEFVNSILCTNDK